MIAIFASTVDDRLGYDPLAKVTVPNSRVVGSRHVALYV